MDTVCSNFEQACNSSFWQALFRFSCSVHASCSCLSPSQLPTFAKTPPSARPFYIRRPHSSFHIPTPTLELLLKFCVALFFWRKQQFPAILFCPSTPATVHHCALHPTSTFSVQPSSTATRRAFSLVVSRLADVEAATPLRLRHIYEFPSRQTSLSLQSRTKLQ